MGYVYVRRVVFTWDTYTYHILDFYTKNALRRLQIRRILDIQCTNPYSTNCYRKLSERFRNYFSISHFILNISDRILQYVIWNDATEMFQKPITCNKFEKVMQILQKRFFFAFWVTYGTWKCFSHGKRRHGSQSTYNFCKSKTIDCWLTIASSCIMRVTYKPVYCQLQAELSRIKGTLDYIYIY